MDDTRESRTSVGALFVCALAVPIGAILAWYTLTWAVFAIRGPLHTPTQSPIPMSDRGPGAQGPPMSYWMSWIIPIMGVYAISALAVLTSARTRIYVVCLLIGFTPVVVFIAPIWISIDAYGFSPS